ncbi:MAG: 50S ribosomal protein L11 methyltransferase [Planctomycetota bacterium]
MTSPSDLTPRPASPAAAHPSTAGEAPPRAPLTWTEVRVDTPLGWGELVAEALAVGPCTSVVFGTTSIAATPPADGCEVVRTFVSSAHDTPELRSALAVALRSLADVTGIEELRDLAPTFKALPPEDWATSWKKSWKPFRVGDIVLLPPWREDAPPRPTDRRLTLQPGGAFGSGRHASTRTVLRVMQGLVQPGARVLDAGSGSGILSVAACLLGAESALGFDIDPMAVPEGEQLADWNGVSARCRFLLGDFSVLGPADAGPNTAFDLIFANIYADVLQAHAADIHARLAPGGRFVFSGCRFDHVDATRPVLREAGLEIEGEHPRGRWWTFVGRRQR